MPAREHIVFMTAMVVTFLMLFLGIGYSMLTISVNTGRIDQYRDYETRITQARQKLSETKDPDDALQRDLADLLRKRDDIKGQIGLGKEEFWHLSFAYCFIPLDSDCFHRNSSETNNVWLAMGSGIIGACLTLLLGFRANLDSALKKSGYTVMSVICLIPTGMIVGLLMLYLLRGTQGTLLTPIADVVQVENPYGIAFACTAAGFFSDRFLSWLLEHVPFKLGPPSPG